MGLQVPILTEAALNSIVPGSISSRRIGHTSFWIGEDLDEHDRRSRLQ